MDGETLIETSRVRICHVRWRYGSRRRRNRRRRRRRKWFGFGRRKRHVKSRAKVGTYQGYRTSNQNNFDNSECKQFIENSEKLTELVDKINRNGIQDVATFSSLTTSIIGATDAKGKFKNGGCNEAQREALVEAHGTISYTSIHDCNFGYILYFTEFIYHKNYFNISQIAF